MTDRGVKNAPMRAFAACRNRWVHGCTALCFAVMAFAAAAEQSGPKPFAPFWDDALFFKRVAYNTLQHGVAGWNVEDGPVFINTSQLHQAVATGLLALFPTTYNASVVWWSALCLIATYFVLRRGAGNTPLAGVSTLILLQAPPTFLTIATGMETAGVLGLVALTTFILFRTRETQHTRVWLLVALQVLTYLARPDAILLTVLPTAALLTTWGKWRDTLKIVLSTGAVLALISLGFYLYYGTPVPLSAYLKLAPISVYDDQYLGLGDSVKVLNLTQWGLVALATLPLIARRLDRESVILCLNALSFVGFHAASTNEIMGYHSRFYAPALPLLFYAALRGLNAPCSARRTTLTTLASSGTAVLALVAYRSRWIEVDGYGLETVRIAQYIVYFAGLPLLLLLKALPQRFNRVAMLALGTAVAAYQMTSIAPTSLTVVNDQQSALTALRQSSALVGMEHLKDCFDEPFTMTHSELGVPGVVFPESRIIDLTGLGNPAIVRSEFSFEHMCRQQRPEFIYRPHWTHRRLNQTINQSRCLKKYYQRPKLRRRSSAPLYVRRDLLDQYRACSNKTR